VNITRLYLTITSLSIPTQWEMTKAKRAYVKEHGECAICGNTKDLEVHHIVPVHIDPTMACSPENFVSLCDWRNHGCHYVFGHYRNFRTKYNNDIVNFARNVKYLLTVSNTIQKSDHQEIQKNY